MVAALAPAPVFADGDGEPADEDGAPGPAGGGHGPADARSAGATAVGRSQGDPDQPPSVDFGADRGAFTEGICAVGDTLWVAFRYKSKLQAYDRSTGERDEDSDLTVGDPARGVWCDGETLWYTTKNDAGKIFAYDMATGTRQQDREFNISGLDFNTYSWGAYWVGPLGIASDGATMWVASSSPDPGNRLYALDMSTKARKPEADIALGSFYPRGLFSDGEFVWVASSVNSTVRAYDISTLARVESVELDRSGGNWGLWSDGEHMWVCDFRNTTLRAYPMPEAYGVRLETLEVSGAVLVRLSSTEWRGHVARGAASVTVTAVAADDEHTVTFGTVDADPDIEGHQWSLALGDNTLEVTVSDGADSRTYTITVVRVDVDALSDDATLSSLSVEGAGVDGFAADMHDYELRVDNDAASVTVTAAASEPAAEVTIAPTDADPVAEGHQVALDEGSNRVAVAVAATDGMATAVYTLTVSRMPSAFGYDGFMDISGLAHRRSMDIWADAQTRWVSYDRSGDEAVLAYDASTGGRAPGRDIAARAAGNKSPWALWSDGASLYVLDTWKSMVFQYRLSDDGANGFGAHVATVSLEGIGEDDATGLWSDGEHMWVANRDDAKVYAYELDGDRVSGEDFDALAAAGNSMPVDLWSDGLVMWVLDKGDRKVYAYDLDSKARLEHLDFPALEGRNGWPSGLWSNGVHMWVSDADDTRAYAYVMPAVLALDTLDASGVNLARSSSREFRGRVARGTESVTVTAVTADGAHTVTFGTVDADPDTEGHQWSLALGDNTLEVTVSDGADSRTYTITVVRVDVDALSDDATLSSLSVEGAGVDGFAADMHDYELRVDNDVASVTVAAAASEPAAQVTIAPADADPDTEGHQVALDEGSNRVAVAVAATDGMATAVYTLTVSRMPSAFGYDGFMDISGLAHRRSMDIWADARTRWVSYDRSGDEAVLAYDASTGGRAPGRDIAALAAGNKSPWALWSDGASLYVLDAWRSMVFQYRLSDDGADGFGAHVATVSLEGIGEDDARGLWSDGETMWVANRDDAEVYAYELDGDRVSGEDFDALAAAGNSMPVDLWSDGQVMWVLDKGDRKIYAYDLDSKVRLEHLDFQALHRRNGWPSGLWSNGEHMWVSDADDTRTYAYVMPAVLALDTLDASGVNLARASSTEFWGRAPRGAATVTVTAQAADDAHTVTFGTNDADPDIEGHQWSLALGDNTLEVTVSDGADSRTYTITVVRVELEALSDDATLSLLSIDGAAVEGFASDMHGYELRVDHDMALATVAATAAEPAAEVTITPADADPDTDGHQVALDVGSNRVVVAVAATDGLATATYTLTIVRQGDPDQPPSVGFGADRRAFTEGICAVGDTLWVAFRYKSKLQAYDRSTGERDEDSDLPIGNPARGVWCDGETLWYTTKSGHDKIFAYDMATGTRQRDLEFDISGVIFNGDRWVGPLGIASDGDTMWVADDGSYGSNRLYALDMATKARKPEADIALGSFYPRGLFSDGEFLWVASSLNRTVRAYDGSTLARVESLDLEVADHRHGGSWGLWSDGDYMWVCNFRHTTLRAYPMPEAYGVRLETLEVSGAVLVGLSPREFRGRAPRGAASVTVTAVAADDAHTVTFGTADADPDTEGHQWSLALGDNTLEITVSDGTDSRAYTITVVKIDVDALSDDATLSSLSVDGAAVAGFAADMHDYELRVDNDVASVTVAAVAAEPVAQVEITPADADPDTEGHQVALDEGPNTVTVAVAATDGLATAAYTLAISRPYSPFAWMEPFDRDGFGEGRHRLAYLWSNGATVWVSEPAEDSIEAYELASGERQGSEVIGGLEDAGNEWARGVWSDGDTMWVADHEDGKLYAYELDGGARVLGSDIDTLAAAGNSEPRGVWSDGDTMWVVDAGDAKLYAYELDGGARVLGSDIDTLGAAGNRSPRDVWSDGDTVWVADSSDAKLYAYALDGGARRAELDFDTLEAAGNANPRGIWSNGDIMWVSDPGDDKLYAYNMPARTETQQQTQQQSQQDEPLQTLQAQQDEQAQQDDPQQDDPQQGGTQQQTQQDDPQQDDPQQDDPQQDDPQEGQVQEDKVQLAPAPNVAATGVPVVAGAVRVGETLVVDTSGIADADGMAGAVFTFLWLADGAAVAGAAGAAYTLVEADVGKVFGVRVSFVDDRGHRESLVGAAAGPVLGGGPPAAPRGLVVAAGDRELTLSWEPPEGNAAVRKYRVEWRIDGRDYHRNRWGTTRTTTYTTTHLANGVGYVFRVTAVNDRGHGRVSEEVGGTPSSGSVVDLATPVLSGPETLHFGMVKLDWDDVDGADRYIVQHYSLSDAEWQDLPAAGIDVAVHGSSAVVANLGPGIWWLRVGAASCAATSEWSEIEAFYILDASDWQDVPIPAVEPGDETEPCPVVLATPVLSGPETLHFGMVKLDWDDVDGADRYIVQHYNLSDADWQDLPAAGIDVAVHGSSAVVTNLDRGIWWLRVGAASCTGTSEWSEIEAFYIVDASDWQDVPVPAIEPGDQPQPCP